MHMMANESQEYCLRWNKHMTNLAEAFDNLLQNESLVDVSLLAEGKQFKAHKIVLSICSPYFQDAFKDLRDKHPIVILKDVKSDHLKALLDYMYKGQVNVAHEELDNFLDTAQSLGVKGFQEGVADNGSVNSTMPMSHMRPKNVEHRRRRSPPPASAPIDMKPVLRHMPPMYSCPSTSVNSVLSTALTMPSPLSLASPLSIPHLSSFPPSLASTIASSFSNAISHPMMAPSFVASHSQPHMNSENSESPHNKRRRKHRRPSGSTMDSGDSDGRSSGSPGDSAVPTLMLPRIPAKIIPVEDIRRHTHSSHQLLQSRSQPSDQQPKDLSIHTSQKFSLNNHDHISLKSPRYPPPSLIKTPTSLPAIPLSIDSRIKPQDEPENLEHRPSPTFLQLQLPSRRIIKSDPAEESNDRCSSPHTTTNSISRRSDGRRSDERSSDQRSDTRKSDEHRSELTRSPSKHGSDPESGVSPTKESNYRSRNDDTSSDNNHFSDDDLDESSNGPREKYLDYTPGPSSSRPHSEEAPPALGKNGFITWPYGHNDPSSSDEAMANLSDNPGQDYMRAIVAASMSGFLPHQISPDLMSQSPSAALQVSLLMQKQQQQQHHLQMQHRDKKMGLLNFPYAEGAKQFPCEKCGRAYASTGNLKRHKKYECGVEPQFACPVCKKKFQHRHSVKIHVYSTHPRTAAGTGGTQGDPNSESTGLFSTDGVAAGVPGPLKEDFFPLAQEASNAAGSNKES